MKRMRLVWCEDFNQLILMDMNNELATIECMYLDIGDSWHSSISLSPADFKDDMLFDTEHILDEWMEEV